MYVLIECTHFLTVAFNGGSNGPDVPLPAWPPSSPHIPGTLNTLTLVDF